MSNEQVNLFSIIDAYVYQSFTSIIGEMVVVQTTQGSLRGVLKTVMPDHLVVEISNRPFYIRTTEVVWVSPE
ncbi:hypothetical protein Q73_06080 [Bacillus coahuilensis m2-6]|uniref:YuzF family protein n=1 Tax=Bacillus coahuilensis TaxID=408580 RepID=UPI0001850D94|nr:YuzF family protein [Bacillus coahuilensis]KUP08435.1 hypothetical protein Q73_06080 [Bacillus coahuilensis m2-6]